MKNELKPRIPWLWIPTLYFAEGIPYFVVNNISVLMFAKMGVPNGEMALFTSLLYLPWTIKPLWSPFVDIIRTKRWWIIAMQILMTAAFITLTLTLARPTAEMIQSGKTPMSMFTLTLILFIITAFASATHDIAADGFYMLGLSQKDQSFYVGIRSTFYRLSNIFGNGVLVAIAGYAESTYDDIPLSWTITLGVTAALFTLITLYHLFFIPKVEQPAVTCQQPAAILSGFCRSFATFLTKKGVVMAILFMLLYRLPEAFLLKLCTPFLVAPTSDGGLGMATQDVGIAYGTIGVVALTVGGIIGGIAASRWGLRKSLWPMAACMTLPCLSFVYLAMAQPDNLAVICTCIAVEQFGYGFGFTAYMLYMMRFADGEFKTSHYAICTAFMALSMMLPGMVAGYLQEWLGYEGFFWMVMVCCVATIAVTAMAVKKIGVLLAIVSCVFASCGEDRTYEYEEWTQKNRVMQTIMQEWYIWGDTSLDQDWKNYFGDATDFFQKLIKKAHSDDTWSYCSLDAQEQDHHERGAFNHLDSYGLDYTTMTDPTRLTSQTYARITTVYDGSPAAECGLERGEFIGYIDGEKVTDKNVSRLKNGSSHKLTVSRLAAEGDSLLFWQSEREVEIGASRKVEDVQVAKADFFVHRGKNIGYVMINHLEGDGFKSTLAELTDVEVLVIDLRLCNYGTPEGASALASCLVSKDKYDEVFCKTVWRDSKKDLNQTFKYDQGMSAYNPNAGTIYFITSAYTAGAAEWAIYGLRHTLGEELVKTVGIGTKGQNVALKEFPTEYGYTLGLSVAYITNAEGSYDYGSGIAPDTEVNEFYDVQLYPYGDKNEIVLNKIINSL